MLQRNGLISKRLRNGNVYTYIYDLPTSTPFLAIATPTRPSVITTRISHIISHTSLDIALYTYFPLPLCTPPAALRVTECAGKHRGARAM